MRNLHVWHTDEVIFFQIWLNLNISISTAKKRSTEITLGARGDVLSLVTLERCV